MTERIGTGRMQFTIADGLVVMVLMMVGLAVISPWLISEFAMPLYPWPSRSQGWLEQYPIAARVKCMLIITGTTLLGAFAAVVVLRERQTSPFIRCKWTGFGVLTSWALLYGTVTVPKFFIRGRTGGNQTAAAGACKAYAEAQEIYRRTDYDGDGVLEYAISLQQLYERTPCTGDLLLIDKTFYGADCSRPGTRGKAGYILKVLHAQGANATGGRQSYIHTDSNGRAHATGYALVASPAVYDGTGRDTFMIDHTGSIYQKDLGGDTTTFLLNVTEFNPDSTWALAE